jgi:GT2 family glycosyltransferase
VRASHGSLLVFTDADVLVRPDTLERIVRAFEEDPELDALFGLYDATHSAQGFLSDFKNLTHRFVHLRSSELAFTFWTGGGAVRRSAFEGVGGFDPDWVLLSDIEFGTRLARSGSRIRLDKSLEFTHLRRYDLLPWLRRDLFGRSVTWTRIILRHRFARFDMNLRGRNILSTLSAFAFLVLLVVSIAFPPLIYASLGSLVLFVLSNLDLLDFIRRNRGLLYTVASILPILMYAWFSGAGAGFALLTHALRRKATP